MSSRDKAAAAIGNASNCLAKKYFGPWTSDAQHHRGPVHACTGSRTERRLCFFFGEPRRLPPLCRLRAHSLIGGHVGRPPSPVWGGIRPAGGERLPCASPSPRRACWCSCHLVTLAAAPARSGAVAGAGNDTFQVPLPGVPCRGCLVWRGEVISCSVGGVRGGEAGGGCLHASASRLFSPLCVSRVVLVSLGESDQTVPRSGATKPAAALATAGLLSDGAQLRRPSWRWRGLFVCSSPQRTAGGGG